MKVSILAFGKIAELTASRAWEMEGLQTTAELKAELEKQHPALRDMPYLLALDKKIVTTNTLLHEQAIVALLPPFSGG